MLNRAVPLALFLILVPFIVTAQETINTDIQTLGTLTQPQIDMAATDDDIPDNIVIDPNFLNDDTNAYDSYNKVIVRILDKVTAETRTFDLNIGKTVAFGSLRIQPKTCKKAPPIEEPESVSFLQIWEKTPEAKDQWVFSGWMFASSPSLSAMEHPVYDVWVIDCKD